AITAAGLDIDTLEGLREAQNSLEFQKISGFRARLAKIKIEAMLELVESYEEAEEPVVIFSAHRAPIDLLGKRAGWAIITGDTNPEKRTAIEEAFQRGELRGIGCTIRAGGVAITLTRSCNAILVDREWDPDLNDQAEDRILRIGQDRPVQITDIVVDHPLDRRVATVLRIKTRRHQASVCASERTTVDVADELYDVETSALIAVAEAELRVWAAGRNRPQNAPSAPQRPAGTPGNGATAVTAPGPAAGTTSTFRGRPARDAREMWAQAGLNLLAGADVDHAKEANTVGFNRMDTAFGHALYECLCAEGGLTDKQWAAALRMLPKYRRQIGAAPTALDEIKAAVA
ncbi:MAG: C-terminal helicase domain-containing protein, partial [Dehalococcoidia bacterium]|nr:C-terminal helicase domain-containing protein [Dehalococcoidia bacterium]